MCTYREKAAGDVGHRSTDSICTSCVGDGALLMSSVLVCRHFCVMSSCLLVIMLPIDLDNIERMRMTKEHVVKRYGGDSPEKWAVKRRWEDKRKIYQQMAFNTTGSVWSRQPNKAGWHSGLCCILHGEQQLTQAITRPASIKAEAERWLRNAWTGKKAAMRMWIMICVDGKCYVAWRSSEAINLPRSSTPQGYGEREQYLKKR